MATIVGIALGAIGALGLWFGLRWADVKRDVDRELGRDGQEWER